MKIQKGFTPPEPKSTETKLREVSDMYEKHFMREMVKAMRSTVHDSGFIQTNQAEKIFREQLDDEYVEKWGKNGGIGLSNLIYDQLIQKYGPMLGKKIEKPHGPLPVDEKASTNLKFELTNKAQSQQMDMKISPKDGKWPSQNVTSAWSGTLLNSIALGDENKMVEIDHGNGLLGKYVFKGWSSDLEPQSKIEAGQVLGKLSPDSNALYWSLRPQSPETSNSSVE
jgi:flagellar protein FlgJ